MGTVNFEIQKYSEISLKTEQNRSKTYIFWIPGTHGIVRGCFLSEEGPEKIPGTLENTRDFWERARNISVLVLDTPKEHIHKISKKSEGHTLGPSLVSF